jgi:hypothetical protein
MGPRWLSELAEDMYSRWLVSAIACCAPQEEKDDARPKRSKGVPQACLSILYAHVLPADAEKQMVIYHQQQPHLIPPPTAVPRVEPPANSQPYRPPVSRRVDSFQRRGVTFRPLELSIYLPENRLSPLPVFSTDDLSAQLEHTAQATLSQRRDSLLSNSQDSRVNYRIARKPVALDGGRRSSDARSTPSTTGSEWLAQPLAPRPSIPESASSQDLIAALEARLPKSPRPLRQRANTAPSPVLHSKDSEQYRRVWAALEERMELERRLREIDTILEERLMDIATGTLDG